MGEPRLIPTPNQPFLGYRLARLNTQEFLDLVLKAAEERTEPLRVGYLNAAQVNLAFADPDHARRLGQMDCLYADGQAVVWAVRWRGGRLPERINAGDFTRSLIRSLAERGLRLALVGGRPAAEGHPSEADRAARCFREWAPVLNVVLTHHGYLDDAASERLPEALEAADPDLVLLGMGAPLQERRGLEWADGGKPRVWWCVGALFEYYAATRLRAPRWMRRVGLEWLFRLALEPRRLFRRYVLGNPLFAWRAWLGRRPKGLVASPNQDEPAGREGPKN